MPQEMLTKLQADMEKQWKDLKQLLDTQSDQIKVHGQTAESTATAITAVEKKLEDYSLEMKGMTDRLIEMEVKANRPPFGGGEEIKSYGRQFIDSEEYKDMIAKKANTSNPVQVKSFFQTKATLTSAVGSAGVLVTPTDAGLLMPIQQDLRIRDLLNVTGTTSNAIEYIRETGFTNAAAPAAETTAKPESGITFAVETAAVRTIAHWLPATNQILADAPQLESYINNRLMYGLEIEEESQLLYGTGTGEDLRGIMVTTGVQDQGLRPTADTYIDHIRRALTKTILAGLPATGVILHPTAWETIELSKGTDGHYIWLSIGEGNTARLFRVPVVQSVALATANDFLVGAFGLGAQIWDREDAAIEVAKEHSDFFTRNMVAIRCEERLALTVYRPEAFVKGTFATV